MSDVFRAGQVHVMAERCATCVFRPGNLMHLSKSRVRGMVASCRATMGGNIPCHETLGESHQAICRGFWDGYAERDELLSSAIRLGIVTYDDDDDGSKAMSTCKVCGSTAETVRNGLPLCRAHVAVCNRHLLDPCPECDAT